MKEIHRKEFNSFPIFFAFSNEQFDDGMKKLNLNPNEIEKIVSIGYGGYIRKSDVKEFSDMMKKQEDQFRDAIKNDLTGEGFIKDMFKYELTNHEYCITYELEDTLNALNLSIDDINNNKALQHGLEIAEKEYLETCDEIEI